MQSTIPWQIDMTAALGRARAEKKNVLMDFFNPG